MGPVACEFTFRTFGRIGPFSPRLSYSQCRRAGEKVPQKGQFLCKNIHLHGWRGSLLEMRPASATSISTQESRRQEQRLQSQVVQREQLPFWRGKNRIFKKKKGKVFLRPVSKGKVFIWNNATERKELLPAGKDDVLLFQQRSKKKKKKIIRCEVQIRKKI